MPASIIICPSEISTKKLPLWISQREESTRPWGRRRIFQRDSNQGTRITLRNLQRAVRNESAASIRRLFRRGNTATEAIRRETVWRSVHLSNEQ